MPRPPKKKTRVIAKARREGELTAEVEHEYKSVKFIADMIPFLPEKYKKNAVIWMKHLVEKHINKIPKGIAILGMTYIIKHLIDTSEELRGKVNLIVKATTQPLGGASLMIELWGSISKGELPFIQEAVGKTEGIFPDWADWLIAFTLAYIIVEYGGQIALGIGSTVKSLSGIVGFLLG